MSFLRRVAASLLTIGLIISLAYLAWECARRSAFHLWVGSFNEQPRVAASHAVVGYGFLSTSALCLIGAIFLAYRGIINGSPKR